MSDHYDRYRGMEELLSTNLAEAAGRRDKKTKLIEIPIPRAKKLLKLIRTSCFREEDLQKVDKWMAKNPKLALYWGTIR